MRSKAKVLLATLQNEFAKSPVEHEMEAGIRSLALATYLS